VQNFAGAGTSGAETHPDLNEYGFFAQDDWRVNPKLTLNLGLRYDVQDLAAPTVNNPSAALAAAGLSTTTSVSDNNNFGPRFGFSYGFDEKTVVRGGYGIFFGRTTAIMLGTSHSQNGIQVTGVSLTCTTLPANPCLTYPNIFTSPPSAGTLTPSLYLFANDYEQPYVQQGRLGIEREVFKNTSLSATYLYFRGVHLSRTRDINLAAPVSTTLTDPASQTFTVLRHPAARPIPGFARINLFESTANSRYHGLALELKRRFTRGLQFIAAYTLSDTKDDRPDQTMVVVGTDDFKGLQNNLDIRSDWGRSDLDIRHRFVFSPVYEIGRRGEDGWTRALLSNWTFSSIITLQSGFAYSALITGDANRDGNTATDRVSGTERNQFTTPSIYIFDGRITKSFQFGEKYNLSFIAEGFNLFNRSNIATVNTGRYVIASNSATTLTNPPPSTPFGAARTFLGERQIQLGVRFKF
ncbi:MAG TPA: TonB-dependent receptor, partial [Pyrinomonadaceae bacterium]|nr:TonB-dependent receptor [Pyrinomonadaceae bacterium]